MLKVRRNKQVGVTAYKRGLWMAAITPGFYDEDIERADDISMLPSGILSRTFNGAFKFFKHNVILVALHFVS